MSGRITDYLAEKWLSELAETTYVALHFDNPDIAGVWASEVFGGGYSRQLVSMYQPNNRAIWNSKAVTFNGLPSVSITHICGWTAQINGDMTFSVALDSPVRTIAGGQYAFGAGVIAISLD